MIKGKISFAQAHAALIRDYKEAFQKLLAIHKDETFLNDIAPDYKKACDDLSFVAREIFKLKSTWMSAVANIEVKAEETRQANEKQ